jgi:hypothetical protein
MATAQRKLSPTESCAQQASSKMLILARSRSSNAAVSGSGPHTHHKASDRGPLRTAALLSRHCAGSPEDRAALKIDEEAETRCSECQIHVGWLWEAR